MFPSSQSECTISACTARSSGFSPDTASWVSWSSYVAWWQPPVPLTISSRSVCTATRYVCTTIAPSCPAYLSGADYTWYRYIPSSSCPDEERRLLQSNSTSVVSYYACNVNNCNAPPKTSAAISARSIEPYMILACMFVAALLHVK
jgi:hypothetical protein